MGLNYSFKLLFSNFSNTWKILLYKVFIVLCAFGLTTVVFWNIIYTLINQNFFVELGSTLGNLLFNVQIDYVINSLIVVFNDLVAILTNANLITESVFFVLFAIVIYYFLNGLFELAMTQEIGGYMSSLTTYGFFNSYISMLGKSILYQLVRIVLSLPFDLLLIVCSYLILNSLIGLIGVFLALFVALAFAIITISLKFTILSCWSPAIVVNGSSTFFGLGQGLKAIFKRFLRSWSSSIVLILALIIVNGFALSFTAGVGLVITLPLSSLLLIIFKNVSFYLAMGMRFYVDNETIITPKKLEEQDKFKKVKNII